MFATHLPSVFIFSFFGLASGVWSVCVYCLQLSPRKSRSLSSHSERFVMYRVFRRNCVFSQFTATPPSPSSLWETFKVLNAMRVYSHSYWLVIFCTTNCRRGRGGKLSRIPGKKQYLINTLYLYVTLIIRVKKIEKAFVRNNHYLFHLFSVPFSQILLFQLAIFQINLSYFLHLTSHSGIHKQDAYGPTQV